MIVKFVVDKVKPAKTQGFMTRMTVRHDIFLGRPYWARLAVELPLGEEIEIELDNFVVTPKTITVKEGKTSKEVEILQLSPREA